LGAEIKNISGPSSDHPDAVISSMETSTAGINTAGRLTALWALSEAALGGVLHVFRIPFTGLFVGSSAVLLITLISFFSQKKGEILRATVIVLIVKAIVSPYTPINSYAAVFLQGLLGEIFFRFLKNKNIAAFLLGVSSLILSAFQKLFVITIVFGMNIWNSIDLFGNYVISQFLIDPADLPSWQISLSLIFMYVLIHLAVGIFAGLGSPKLSRKIVLEIKNRDKLIDIDFSRSAVPEVRKKSRRLAKKISGYFIFMIAFSIMMLSYIFPVFEKSQGNAAMIMVFRSVTIMVLWYFIIGPYLLKRVRILLAKKEHRYSAQVDEILDLFPKLKLIVKKSWDESKEYKRSEIVNKFFIFLFVRILSAK